jgi:spore coat polysaccharide biosynthesis protein SpsF
MSKACEAVVVVVQARMTSSRFPGKIMQPLAGSPLVRRTVERAARIKGVDRIVVALAEGKAHDAAMAAFDGLGVDVVRGDEHDVLARTAAAARAASAGVVVRITSDCPLVDPPVSEAVLAAYMAAKGETLRYARTAFDEGFPLGFDTEVMDASALYEADERATDPYEREHVTPYIWRRPDQYPSLILTGKPDRRAWRLVVDTEDDYRLVSAVYDAFYPANPEFGYAELCGLFAARPDLLCINAHVKQNPYVGLHA